MHLFLPELGISHQWDDAQQNVICNVISYLTKKGICFISFHLGLSEHVKGNQSQSILQCALSGKKIKRQLYSNIGKYTLLETVKAEVHKIYTQTHHTLTRSIPQFICFTLQSSLPLTIIHLSLLLLSCIFFLPLFVVLLVWLFAPPSLF